MVSLDTVQWLCLCCERWWECDDDADYQVCPECGTVEV
jgi:DNA-directed RNA polymerase subunit RPC12/RpoP